MAGFAAHGLAVVLGLDLGWGHWPAVVAFGVLAGSAVYGLVRPGGIWSVARAAAAVLGAVALGEVTGGTAASVWTAWIATFALFFPIALDLAPALAAAGVPAVAYLVASHLGVDHLGLVDAGMRAAALVGAGVSAFLVGHVVLGLRRERDAVADRLKEAESVIDAAFATSLGGMAVLDLDGRVVTSNRAFARFLGRNDELPIGAEWALLTHPAESAEMSQRVAALASGDRSSVEVEARFPRVDGTIAHAVVGMSSVDDAEGRPAHLFVHVTNISDRVHSERRLRQSESHYRHLFELSPVPLWEVDVSSLIGERADKPSGRIDLGGHLDAHPEDLDDVLAGTRVRNVNESARALFGAPDDGGFAAGLASGRLGRDHTAAYADLVVGISRGILQGERPVTVTDFGGGEHVGTLRMLVPRVDGVPDLTGVVVAFVDVTEQTETEETLVRLEEQLHTVMAGAPIIVFAIDADGVYTLSEGQALSIVGQPPGSVVGRSIFEVHRNTPAVLRNMRRALAGEQFTGVDEVGQLLFETRYTPVLKAGRVSGVIGVSYDITERVRTAERLRELVRSKDDFVATVSHELRTPLTAVVGFAHELRTGLDALTRDDIEAYVGLIEEQGTEVADLVEDLLVASRADHGEVPISLGATDLWEQVDAVLRARALSKTVDLSARSGDAKVFADAIRVRQIVRNLLINADRYGGRTITVRSGDGDGTRSLEIRDDGAGIPPNQRPFIFEPYHRAHREDGRTESVGLGLTVSRHLAQLMGGQLTYSYTDGESVFTLTLPAA